MRSALLTASLASMCKCHIYPRVIRTSQTVASVADNRKQNKRNCMLKKGINGNIAFPNLHVMAFPMHFRQILMLWGSRCAVLWRQIFILIYPAAHTYCLGFLPADISAVLVSVTRQLFCLPLPLRTPVQARPRGLRTDSGGLGRAWLPVLPDARRPALLRRSALGAHRRGWRRSDHFCVIRHVPRPVCRSPTDGAA